MSEYVDPAKQPAHDRWIADGHCPVISGTKAWCNLQAGHAGDHASPYITDDSRPGRGQIMVHWHH